MRAPSSDASQDEGAEKEEMDLDYSEFFSVLMYYGHMSKEEIMNSSRPFLYGIYQQYAKRACENLGVSPDGEKEEHKTELRESDYPESFGKLDKPMFNNTQDFLKEFGNIPGLSKAYIDDGTAVLKEM